MERPAFPRMRAQVICVICHERKVRCDLQLSRDKTCSNCRRMNQPCVQRQGRRTRTRPVRPVGDSIRRTDKQQGIAPPVHSSDAGDQTTTESKSFISSDSVLYEETPPNNPHPLSWRDWQSTEKQLQSRYSHVSVPLDDPLRLALLDCFSEHWGHMYPFINMTQLRDTPPLLQKALLLAGSLVRRIDTVEDLQLPYALYQQAKEAIHTSSGSDTTTLLKAITITSCWSLRPPSVISLDGPWHWAGIAMRLALQLGLHREKTYSGLRDSNSCRLVWWYLVNSDVLQAACWGRPCLIQDRCQDVQLPTHSDLDSLPLQTFNQVTRLLLILRQVIEPETSQLSDIVNALADWHRALPLPLKLHSTDGSRNSYNRPGNEMFIIYFAIIMLVLFQADRAENRQTPVSLISIAASSCIVRLYEEIHLHEDSPRLSSVHGFFLMLAAIPQIFHRTESAAKERLREHELDVICQVLQALHVKYGGSNMVLQKISKLRAESDELRESEPPSVNTGSYLESSTGAIDSSLLFPFPAHFSPNLDLLDDYENNSRRNGAMDLLAFESSLIDWSADDFFDAGDFPQSMDL